MTERYGLIVCLLVFLGGCRKGDQIPHYIDIPAVSLIATDLEGGNTSKITDVWVALDDRSLGVWELPARVPLLGPTVGRVTITPGVKRNGSFDDRLQYPFYTSYSTGVELTAEGSTTLSPTVNYSSLALFWTEQFQDQGNNLNVSDQSDTTLLLFTPFSDPEVLLDGTSCGGFALDAAHTSMSIYTTQDFYPTGGPVFFELDYSTDINFTIGLTYEQGGTTRYDPWVILLPTASEGQLRWNKAYADISVLFDIAGISGRDIYIAAELPSGQATAHVYLDNLKLVRRL